MSETVVERVWQIAEPLITDEGMEIVDVEYRRESHGMVLRLYLDRIGGGGSSLDDLTRVSRQASDLLDVHDVVPGAYTLEVSSPGINRRLRRPDHFMRYVGQPVRVRTFAPLDGRRVFAGRLDGVDAEGVTVAQDGVSWTIRFSEIAQANYEPEIERPRR